MRFATPFIGAVVLGAACAGCGPAAEPDPYQSSASTLSAEATPVILTHGLAAWPFDKSLQPHLEAMGYTVFMPKVSPFGPVKHRAEELRVQIDEFLDSVGAAEGVMIAHSMGGVDARWLLSPDGLAYDRIPAVVTIASPHRGTAIADTVVGGVPFFLQSRFDRLLKAMGLAPDDAENLEALHDLTSTEMAAFNLEVRDSADVEYYSYSSQQRPTEGLNPLLYVSYYVIKSDEGANDGIASVEGAKWGHYLGDLNADHADHVGGLGLKTKFDFLGLYSGAIQSAFDHHNGGTYDPTHSVAVVTQEYPQSQHDYWNNLVETHDYDLPGASSLAVTFDARTEVEEGYDFIHVTDADGTPIAGSPFTGQQLAGVTVEVPGQSVQIRMESDFSVTRWGYGVTQVEAQ